MDKFDKRLAHAKQLQKQRIFSQLSFSLLALAQLAFGLLAPTRDLDYFLIFFFILDFFYFLNKRQKDIFIDQIRNALLDMEQKVCVGRIVLYPMPVSYESGSSYLWESIRARVLYRYRYHARSFDYNFLVSNSSDPAQCAWSAAWFFAADDLEHTPSEDRLRFAIQLAAYGLQYDYFSDSSYEDWCSSIRYRYTDPALKSIVNDFLKLHRTELPSYQ